MKSKPLAKAMGLAVFLLFLAGCSSLTPSSDPHILTDMGQLKLRFNQAKGKARLVLLVSPT